MAFNWFKKLKTGLSKSAQKVEKAFTSVIGKKKLNEISLTEIEDQLISSDLGVNASIKIVDKLRSHKFELTSKNKEISKEMILQVVKDELNKILINSEKSLNNLEINLLDLKSRLKNCLFAEIQKPDDILIQALLTKNLADHQILIDSKLIDFISKKITRSYSKIREFVCTIDKISLKKKKPINFKIIKEILEDKFK